MAFSVSCDSQRLRGEVCVNLCGRDGLYLVTVFIGGFEHNKNLPAANIPQCYAVMDDFGFLVIVSDWF